MSNPTNLVSQFDGDLAYTDRAGAGAWSGTGPIRYDGGLWIEESGLNYVIDPLFHHDINTVFWANNGKDAGISATLERYLEPPAVGRWSIASVSSIGSGGHMYLGGTTANGTFAPGDPVTASARVRSSGFNGDHAIAVRGLDTLGNPLGTFTQGATVPCDGADHDIFVTIPSLPANTAKVVVYVTTHCLDLTPASETSDCLRCNIEKSLYPTSLMPEVVGTSETLAGGYAFDGTAHASTSTRAASSASVPTAGHISPVAGAISFFDTRVIDTGAEEIIIEAGTVGSGTDAMRIGYDATDHPFMEWNSDNAGWERVTATDIVAAGVRSFLYFDWQGAIIRCSVNTGTMASDTRNAVEGDWGAGDLELVA